MVYRIYTEKKKEYAKEAAALLNEARTLLSIERLRDVRIINRYDADNIDGELFESCIWKVFAEPQLDDASGSIEELIESSVDERGYAADTDAFVFAYGTLPQRRDLRAESAEQCIRFIDRSSRPTVSCAKVCVLYGELMPADIDAIINYVIDPAESVRTSLELPETLAAAEETAPYDEARLEGFSTMSEAAFGACIDKLGLAMDEADLGLCVEYFRETEQRDPDIAELRVIDAFRSERCARNAVNTVIDSVIFEDPLLEKAYKDYLAVRKELGRNKPVTMKDIAGMAVRSMKRSGRLEKVEKTGDNGVCTVNINVEVDGENEPWVLCFKSIENLRDAEADPYGAAAGGLGDCIRDTLTGRAYAYSAMRLCGGADPLKAFPDTLPGRLPQRVIAVKSAEGASDYSAEAGIPVSFADEIYHPGYEAGRLETGAVMAAAPAVNIRKERPEPGDIVVMLGGPSGHDGAAQISDASEEHRLMRLMRNASAARMIKECCNLGAGGIAVCMGRLADGISIDLDAVPKVHEGTDTAGIALGEEPERMACVISPENEDLFRAYARSESLGCVRVGVITDEKRLVMSRGGRKAIDISSEFLKEGAAQKHVEAAPEAPSDWQSTCMYNEALSFSEAMRFLAQDINTCSRRGLAERFDSTAGAGTVLMPFGGRNQLTPVQTAVQRIPAEHGETHDCSMMAYGFNPFVSEASPYHGAYLSVVESVSKLIAAGSSPEDIYICLHHNFGTPGDDSKKWGSPFAAVLGAFEAQMGLGIGAIGLDGTMTDSFDDIEVPPALISFAVKTSPESSIISPEFKEAGHKVVMISPYTEKDNQGPGKGLPEPASVKKVWEKVCELIASGKAVAAYAPGRGGAAEAIMKMCYGNGIGFSFDFDSSLPPRTPAFSARKARTRKEAFGYSYGSIILELTEDVELSSRSFRSDTLGYTSEEQTISLADESVSIGELLTLYEGKLESVFPAIADGRIGSAENFSCRARSWDTPIFKRSEPKVLIPVFPGTSCEYESERAVREAGAVPELMLIQNRTEDEIKYSVENFAAALKDAQIVFIPGGCSGSCEPDGSAKLITSFFRSEAVAEGVNALLEKQDGLICGICDGFQALIKLGLVPYGKYTEMDENSPTLTYNNIGCSRSKIVRVRVASNGSPWMRGTEVGDIFSIPVAHAEGRFTASEELIRQLVKTGQIATQYVDLEGNATGDTRFNPNGSMMAVEGITSPDGRIFGRMAHSERVREGLYRNVEGRYVCGMFENAVRYFK